MSEPPRPKLTLVDAAIAEVGQLPGVQPNAVKAVLNRYAGSIAKRAGAERERAILTKIGAATIEEVSALPALRASFEREEAKHVKGAFGWGALWGALGGLVLGAAISLLVALGYGAAAFQNAQQATQQGALIGAAAANQDPDRRARSAPYIHGPREPADAPVRTEP